MSKFINNSHDKAFRKALSHPKVAKDVFQQGLPPAIQQHIDWSTMAIQKDTFVDEAYRYELSDLVYQVKMTDGRAGVLYLLCEHLSKPRKNMPFYVLSYMVKIMRHHLEQGHEKLPLVLPLVLYHGKSAYVQPTDLFECFDAPELARAYFYQPHSLIDLTQMSNEDILKYKWAALMEMLFKHIFARDLLPIIELLSQKDVFNALEREGGEHYALDMINYTINTAEISDAEKFNQAIAANSEPLGRKVMTIFEQFQQREKQAAQQGMQQGMQQGKKEGLHEVARTLLARDMPASEIADITHLSVDEIEKL